MAKLTGLASIVAELRAQRTKLVNELRHVDAALAVLGKLDGGSSYTVPRRTLSASARRQISLAQKARWARYAVAKGEDSQAKENDVCVSTQKDCSCATRTVGEAQSKNSLGRWQKRRGLECLISSGRVFRDGSCHQISRRYQFRP